MDDIELDGCSKKAGLRARPRLRETSGMSLAEINPLVFTSAPCAYRIFFYVCTIFISNSTELHVCTPFLSIIEVPWWSQRANIVVVPNGAKVNMGPTVSTVVLRLLSLHAVC